jgi:hypothetical protein
MLVGSSGVKNSFEIQCVRLVDKINVTIAAGIRRIRRLNTPFADFRFGEYLSATLVSHVERLLVSDEAIATTYNTEHATGIAVDDGFFLRHGQSPFACVVGKIHEYRMFFHRKENIVQFIEAWHGFSFIFCVQVRSRKEKGANSTHPERGTAKRLCQE